MKKINKISILFLSLLVLIFASCENEPLEGFPDDLENPFSNSLVGTWSLVSFNTNVTSTTEFNGMTVESSSIVEGVNPNYDLTFTANTFSTNGEYGYNVTTTVNGQTSSQNLSVQNVTGAGNYTVDGNQLTTDGSFFTLEFQGMNLSDFQGEQTIDFIISSDGQTLTFDQNTTETNGAGGAMTTSVVTGSSVWTKTAGANTSCADASDFATTAETAYNNDTNNVDLCNAYKAALQNQINACGDAGGELQSIIDGLGDCEISTSNIIGTWELTAFTSNGEELPDVCLGDIEVFTATTYTYDEVWGDNCENITQDDTPESYSIDGNQLTVFDEGESDVYEIVELTETSMIREVVYSEMGIQYTDVETYTKQ